MLPLYQVDAFSDRPFAGNPAAVCPLESWLPAETMQAIAAENNLAETAFFVPRSGAEFEIRWFTPAVEVELCGHATLASAHVLHRHLGFAGAEIVFHSQSGPLRVLRDAAASRLTLDFPSRPPRPLAGYPPDGLADGLRATPLAVLAGPDLVAVFGSEAEVRALRPDLARLAQVEYRGIIATAPAADADTDFVSRFFGPRVGVPEDPVTGSAHTTLVPYWADKLGRFELRARQVSARGGRLWCELRGERVFISGHAVTYLRGEIEVA